MPENLIPISEAVAMTALYRSKREGLLAAEYRPEVAPICESFSKDVFSSLLELEDCIGVRIYCGMAENFNIRFIICGVNSNNEDVYFPADAVPDSQESHVIEAGVRCPDLCPSPSVLNSD